MAEKFTSFKKDPTKTVGIRKRWIGQYSVRFTALKSRITKLMNKGVEGKLKVPKVKTKDLTSNTFEFTSDAQAVAEFMSWLQLQVDDLIFGNDASATGQWQNKFVDQAYTRGIRLTKADLRRLGITAAQLKAIQSAPISGVAAVKLGFGVGGAFKGVDLRTIHLDAVRLLYIREFNALKGITEEMSRQISRVLVEGIEQGLGVREIAANINDRVSKIGLTRSKLLARTETARAYNLGTITEFDDVTNNLGIEPMFEWVTAGDGRVRPTHVERNGKIYTKQKAAELIGEPNCRCALTPHINLDALQEAA